MRGWRLAGASAVVLLATLAVGLRVATRSVERAEAEALLAEAATAVELYAEVGGSALLDDLFGDRWTTSSDVHELLDRPVRVETPDGPVARGALYAGDRWTVVGTLELEPRPAADRPLPTSVPWTALLAAAGLLAVSWHWPRWAADGGPAGTLLPALACLSLLAPPLLLAAAWSSDRLAEVTELRLQRARSALAAVPDPEAVMERPGGVSQLTGLSFVERTPDGGVAFSTLLPATARELAALEPPLPDRVTVRRSPYAVAEWGRLVLATVPYEHTHRPRGALVGTVLAGLLLASLPAVLAPLTGRRRQMRRNVVAWAFLAPAALHLAVFTLGPLAFALWLSFHEWTLVDPARPFVGLAHYAALFRDGDFWNAMMNTAVFTLHVPVAMAVALGFALLVHGRTRAVALVRATLFLPSITSLVAIAVVWQWMLNDQYGLLNWALTRVGLDPVPWLSSPRTALLSLMLLGTWIVVGYQMVLFQAGLAAIPRELYEAARIDGAGPWSRFLHVTLPGLRHTVFFVLVTSVIGSFQVFGAVYVMTEGGPLGSTDVAVYHIYREAWEFLRFGNAAAMSWILFAVIFAVTWLHFRVLERRAEA